MRSTSRSGFATKRGPPTFASLPQSDELRLVLRTQPPSDSEKLVPGFRVFQHPFAQQTDGRRAVLEQLVVEPFQ